MVHLRDVGTETDMRTKHAGHLVFFKTLTGYRPYSHFVFYICYKRNIGSYFGVLHGVMDAIGKLGEQSKI